MTVGEGIALAGGALVLLGAAYLVASGMKSEDQEAALLRAQLEAQARHQQQAPQPRTGNAAVDIGLGVLGALGGVKGLVDLVDDFTD